MAHRPSDRMTPSPRWGFDQIPDLSGQRWLITGATRGLGLETARIAAEHGAELVLAVRDTTRGAEVAQRLATASGEASPAQIQIIELDLAQLSSVRGAAEQVPPIDVLINNAGVTTTTRTTTAEGFELHLGVNALAPFLFTNLVLDRIRRRVVILGSLAHFTARLDFDDPHFQHRRWSTAAAYGQSKLADLLWARALQDRLTAHGSPVDVQLAHPGWAGTELANAARTRFGRAAVDRIAAAMANPVPQAALSILYAATQPLAPCSYVGPDGVRGLRGYPVLCARSAQASDPALARKWWAFAEASVSGR
ncbi:SDR family NAD(P)-dependent oxidoreductase [Gulosibacter massiliensis]|uniref:SDR family NAD(P)-dependent oxidoreductase n=1 Tax=Gulosibacter massiliensis TaxID=2479839 RepID=UPI001F49E187|nr:SDR family NAD(P)-dependent oxidoreductase [Gulosibacter massiliensis]